MIHNTLAAGLVILLGAANVLLDAVLEHRATLTAEQQDSVTYLSLLPSEGDEQADLWTATRLLIPSSSRQPIIEYATPQRLGELPIAWIDVDQLLWDKREFLNVMRSYPYDRVGKTSWPMIVRADWLLIQLSDGKRSDAYRRLLFGTREGKLIDKSADLFKLFNVQNFDFGDWGHIEGDSGVANQKIRLIKSLAVPRGYGYITFDAFEINQLTDPLNHLDRGQKFDGSEIIVGQPRVSLATNQRSCSQVYWLADGNGNVVNAAPIGLVTDHNKTFDSYELIACGACISCHANGLQKTTRSEYHEFIAAGGQLFEADDDIVDVQAFFSAKLDDDIEGDNELYARFVNAACEATPGEASAAFRRAVARYDRPLDLIQSATELDVAPDVWREALTRPDAEVKYGRRVAGLGRGQVIQRDAWEGQYLELYEVSR